MKKRANSHKHLTLPTIGIIALFITVSLLLLAISYHDYFCGYEWWSNALMGISSSLITGVIVYVLTNYRSAKYLALQNEYLRTKGLYDCLNHYKRDVSFFKKHHRVYDERSVSAFIEDIADSIDNIEEMIEELPERVFFKELNYVESYPVSEQMKENIRKAYLLIDDEDDWGHIEKVCELLISSYDLLSKWIKPVYQDLNQRFGLYQTHYY